MKLIITRAGHVRLEQFNGDFEKPNIIQLAQCPLNWSEITVDLENVALSGQPIIYGCSWTE